MRVLILTSEHNAYDQFGEYFEEVFTENPTIEKLKAATGRNDDYCEWLLKTGGGRQGTEDFWYKLHKVNCK